MEIYKAEDENVLIASLSGELDHHSAGVTREKIDAQTARYGMIDLILDMTNVTFMDSSGIGVVLGRYRKITEKNGQVVLAGCSDYVEKILSMAGIFKRIPKVGTVEEGMIFLREHPGDRR